LNKDFLMMIYIGREKIAIKNKKNKVLIEKNTNDSAKDNKLKTKRSKTNPTSKANIKDKIFFIITS